ncbi:DUF1120 domain-containing protein [Lelliottia wanjuensis]|uniref:DUF1120 domain-containing protein n=1 Tax=Lelliottia wanjuensis TaxID=3050585 RepID=A0AAP4D3S8_9ENTR|nr:MULTISPECIES: DUF1120 domain-containing protein [unclassified Lelliottia]MDK9363660.1 DUF1120 domain-containing protein [Lelliottia sp. V106_12]MDK9619201.1 DUF1120 domain-containing protein [Lelliottia sp. V106_9]
MKNIFKLCATAALVITTAHSAFAADSTDLKVQGTLIMGSCTPTLSSGGVVDYGKISLGNLKTDAVNQLGTKEITLTLTCESPTKVAWSTMDDQSDSIVDTQPEIEGNPTTEVIDEFGLGKTAGGVNIGSYSIITANNGDPIVDGLAGTVGISEDDAATWTKGGNGGAYSHNDGSRLMTYVDATGVPVAFTTASDILRVGASVQDTTTLAITDDTPLNGQATISVKYL